jgi:hypothetical protein
MYGAVKKDKNHSESAGFKTFPKVGNSEFDKCRISSSVFTAMGLDLLESESNKSLS